MLSPLLDYLLPWKVIKPPYNCLGIVFAAAGAAINLRAYSLFKKNKTTVKPNQLPCSLITYGPYSFSRHPMYLGMILALLGLAVFLGSLASFAGPLLFIAAMEVIFIPPEEKCMRESFGAEYEAYCNKVRKWI